MKINNLVSLILLLEVCLSYLDVEVEVVREADFIAYNIPMKVNDNDYDIAISMENNGEFVSSVSTTKKAKNKRKHKNDESIEGLSAIIKATSLEGYSFEGWKRFFMEALLWVESRYYHDITIDLSEIEKSQPNNGQLSLDGMINFGPSLKDNKMFQLLKKQSEFIPYDIVSIYRGSNDKNVRLQLGGFEESFAKGMNNGILFYEVDLESEDGKWKIPVKTVLCLRLKNSRNDVFYIAGSEMKVSISINSPLIKLPISLASELERNFESPHTTCKTTESNRFSCTNFTIIDMSLHFLQFEIDQNAFINISLSNLIDKYDEKTTETIFNIEFVPGNDQLQIGESLFKSYYVSIDLENKKMLYSPLNHFPSENYAVNVIRFMVGFAFFTIATAIGAMLWQNLNDPYRKNEIGRTHDGVRLVEYDKVEEDDY